MKDKSKINFTQNRVKFVCVKFDQCKNLVEDNAEIIIFFPCSKLNLFAEFYFKNFNFKYCCFNEAKNLNILVY